MGCYKAAILFHKSTKNRVKSGVTFCFVFCLICKCSIPMLTPRGMWQIAVSFPYSNKSQHYCLWLTVLKFQRLGKTVSILLLALTKDPICKCERKLFGGLTCFIIMKLLCCSINIFCVEFRNYGVALQNIFRLSSPSCWVALHLNFRLCVCAHVCLCTHYGDSFSPFLKKKNSSEPFSFPTMSFFSSFCLSVTF